MEKRQKLIDVWVTDDGVEHASKHAAELHVVHLNEAKELSAQQRRNAQTEAEHKANAERMRSRFIDHPEELEAFLHLLHAAHMVFMNQGVAAGWWADVKPTGDPIPNPKIVKISDLDKHETLMAHVVHGVLGMFESVTEAKKNGWNKPVQEGDFWLNKKTIHLKVVA